METKELIQALRADAEWAHANEWETPITLGDHLDAAADALAAVTAQLTDYHHMEQLVDGKMAENQRLRKINEKLQSQFAASQRREKAAVEDLKKLATKSITPCHSCAETCLFPASLAPEYQPPAWCREWKWRGPQAEKGEAE